MDSEVFVSSLQKTNLIAILCTGNTTDRLHLLFVFFRLEALKWKPTKELKKKKGWCSGRNTNLRQNSCT